MRGTVVRQRFVVWRGRITAHRRRFLQGTSPVLLRSWRRFVRPRQPLAPAIRRLHRQRLHARIKAQQLRGQEVVRYSS